jgi:hypothetical protein
LWSRELVSYLTVVLWCVGLRRRGFVSPGGWAGERAVAAGG